MITEYIQAALRQAHYELEEGVYYGEIPGFDGIVASGNSLELCREQLIDVLEGWLIVGIRHSHWLSVKALSNLLFPILTREKLA